MTPTKFKSGRRALKLSQNELAETMGMKTSRTIRRWEKGKSAIPADAAYLLEWLVSGKRPPIPQDGGPAMKLVKWLITGKRPL